MTVIPSAIYNPTVDESALKLPRYAQVIRYDENAFFGINSPTNRDRACRQIWTKIERDMIARNLWEAQDKIERVLHYPIGQKWFTNEQHRRVGRFFTKWSHVSAIGSRAETVIAAGVALNHAADPAVIPATATSLTDLDDIHFYQAGTTMEIYPSVLTVDGGFLNASFPRARLVKADSQENPPTGWPYDATGPSGPFIQEIDIKRVFTDSTDAGVFVWPLGKERCPECSEETEPACGYIQSNEAGVVTLLPDNSGHCYYCGASYVRVNYCAGIPIDPSSEEAILHLAHSLMAVMPCQGCDPIMMLWKQDQFIPENITSERANALFGVMEGAWRAYSYAVREKHVRTPLI